MTHYKPYADAVHTPEAESKPFRLSLYWLAEGFCKLIERCLDHIDLHQSWMPFRLAVYWFTEGCLTLVERCFDRLDVYEAWITARNWKLYDKLVRGFFGVLVCICCFYVAFLIGTAICYVVWTQGGELLRSGR